MMTDAIIATGNSMALKIEDSAPPTFGTAMESSKIGKIMPKIPNIIPKIHKFVLNNVPFQIISGDKKMEIMINATSDIRKVRVTVGIPSICLEFIWINMAKLVAASNP